MTNEFVNPNWHVALVHFPIGLLIAGTLIELFSFMWRRHSFRAAGRWMILLGALGAIPTAMSGIYALADVSRMGVDEITAAGPWRELSAESPVSRNHDQAHMLSDHVVLQSWGAGLAILAAIVFLGASDAWRARLHLPLLAVLVIASGLTIAGAWHGGEAVYRHGTGVMPVVAPDASLANLAVEQSAAAVEQQRPKRDIEYFLPPRQLHMVMAGFTVALALAAVGLSFRVSNSAAPRTEVDYIAEALGPPSESVGIDTEHPRTEPYDRGPRVPSARFWLLTVLVGLLTSFAGWWVLASASGRGWNIQALWDMVRQPVENQTFPWLTRRLAHVAGGTSIVVLALLMAVIARVAPRSKLMLILFTLLLLAVVAAQIWFGILLTYDTVEGPVTRFN